MPEIAALIPEFFAATAAAAAPEAIGAGAAGLGAAEAAGAGGLADLVGTGAGLFGGTTGLEGTLLAGGAGGLGDVLGASAAGLGALGTAADFLAAPGAGAAGAGFGVGADAAAAEAAQSGLASGTGGITSTPSIAGLSTAQPFAAGGVSSNLSPSVANANAGASVFDTGTSPLTGVSSGGAPSAAPAGASASSVAAPSGVTGLADPTAAAGGAAPAGGAAAPSSSIADLLKGAGSGAMKSLTSNPLGIALGAGGLGYNILQGQKMSANQKALSADAAQATANSNRMTAGGEALQQYLTNGTLPAAYQQQVDQAIEAAKTRAISNAAARGLSTDPTQNTTLAQELAGIDNQRSAMQTQVASQLFSSGSSLINAGQSAAGLSGNLYQALVQNDTTSAANTGKAIATLAAALNGRNQASGNGITISTGA